MLNGQQNYIDVLFENKTPGNVSVKSISGESPLPSVIRHISCIEPCFTNVSSVGSLTNPKTGAVIRNVRLESVDPRRHSAQFKSRPQLRSWVSLSPEETASNCLMHSIASTFHLLLLYSDAHTMLD